MSRAPTPSSRTAIFALLGISFVWSTGALVFLLIRGIGLATGRMPSRGWPGEAVPPLMLLAGVAVMLILWRAIKRGGDAG